MRLHPGTALVAVCLCLWIPFDQSHATFAPEDQDGSGDDDIYGSGSGSGDDDIFFNEPDATTRSSPKTTNPAWYTDAPVILLEHPVTQNVTLDTEPETPGHITEAPYTTQITESQPSPVIIKSPGSEEDQKGETTTFSDVAQPETTVPPAEKLPVVPTHKEERTTTAYDEDTEESSVIDQEEDEPTVHVEGGTGTTDAPGKETTPVLLRTTSASNLVDPETSGDAVESTPEVIDFNENIIPEHREPELMKPTTGENEIQNPGSGRSGSGLAQGSASDDDSLLERKEVLAGVIAGGVVGLAFAIMLVALMVYRMKKKDEGSYSLDEHKHPNGGYQKPLKQEEFLA